MDTEIHTTKSIKQEKKDWSLSSMKPWLRLVLNMSGYDGLQLSLW